MDIENLKKEVLLLEKELSSPGIFSNQEKFAEKVEMDFTAISRYIHGRAFPNEKNFKRIWNELGISYNTLEEFLEDI